MKIIELSDRKLAIVDDDDFVWLKKHKWTFMTTGYAYRMEHTSRAKGIKRYSKCVLMHREILKATASQIVDHINGNRLDNRKQNLRSCSHRQNLMNRPQPKNNISGYKGVSLYKRDGTWEARIRGTDRYLFLGRYKDPKEAALAYNNKAKEVFGEFAYLNKI